MCSCTTAKCAGCTCGCFHTPATRRSYWQGLYAAREAVAAKAMHSPKCFALLPDFDERDCNCAVAYSLAAIDALREKP